LKIGLLTPYTGSNLGDAAIQQAVIDNIRIRRPDTEICLITLHPELTGRLHGVPSFPLTSLSISNYSQDGPISAIQGGELESPLEEQDGAESGLLSRIKTLLKKYPRLFLVLKNVHNLLFVVARIPKLVLEEISHFIKARNFLKSFGILLVSGGGQLDDYWGGPWGHPYSLLKWGIIAKTVGVRFVFLSVGTCSLESRFSSLLIRWALSLADYRSYRDQTSKALLKHLAFTHQDQVYPDLAFSNKGKGWVSEQRVRKSGKIVAVSPIAYLSRYGWPKMDISVYNNYINNLVFFIAELIRCGYSILLFSTDTPDRHVIKEIIASLSNTSDLDLHEKIQQACTETIDELFSLLSVADYVVASRLHGVLLAHLFLKPVLAISYDRKVDTYMKDICVHEYCLDIHNFGLNTLMCTFEEMVSNADRIESRLKEAGAEYVRLLGHQYDIVLDTKT